MENISLYILAIVQGVTEWLPVSSSGHLAVLYNFSKLNKDQFLAFSVFLHLASLVALLFFLIKEFYKRNDSFAVFNQHSSFISSVPHCNATGSICSLELRLNNISKKLANYFIYFFSHIFKPGYNGGLNSSSKKTNNKNNAFEESEKVFIIIRLLLLIAIVDLPAAIVGFFLRDSFSEMFTSSILLAGNFTVTALLLLSILFKETKNNSVTIFSLPIGTALVVGFFQCFALMPGISRSGTTIAVATLLGVDGRHAALFSVLLLVPLVLGASLLELVINGSNVFLLVPISTGILLFLVTVAVSILSLQILTFFSARYKLHYFSIYLLLLAAYLFAF